MADVTPILINQLASQATLQDTDYFIVGGDDAKKITVGQMKEALGINSLNTNKIETGDFSVSTLSGSVTLANGYGSVSINAGKAGYKALGIVGFNIASTYHAPSAVNFDATGQKVNFTIRHVNDASASGNISVYASVLYVKI